MTSDEIEDRKITDCVNGICKVVKTSRGSVKGRIRTVLGFLTPLLVASPDPRIKALGLAVQAGSMVFLGEPRGKSK